MALVLLALLFAGFVWPTPYRYFPAHDPLVVARQNRFTGTVTWLARGDERFGPP